MRSGSVRYWNFYLHQESHTSFVENLNFLGDGGSFFAPFTYFTITPEPFEIATRNLMLLQIKTCTYVQNFRNTSGTGGQVNLQWRHKVARLDFSPCIQYGILISYLWSHILIWPNLECSWNFSHTCPRYSSSCMKIFVSLLLRVPKIS